MASRRQQVLAALVARVQAITVDDGFNTDAGTAVYLGETPMLGPDDPLVAIALIVGDDDPGYQGEHVFVKLPIEIQGVAFADQTDSWMAVEAVIEDIKRAVELEDRSLGKLLRSELERGPTRTLRREPGSSTVGAGVTYLAPIAEKWGTP